MMTPSASAVAHRPWCTDHVDATLGGLIPAENVVPADELCRRWAGDPDGDGPVAALTWDLTHGPMVFAYRCEEMTPAQARRFALDLLALVAAAAGVSR